MERIDIRIPAGIESGQFLNFGGRGHHVVGGIPGKLVVQFRVMKHPKFKRNGLDIISQINISMTQAVLGDQVFIETIDGKR